MKRRTAQPAAIRIISRRVAFMDSGPRSSTSLIPHPSRTRVGLLVALLKAVGRHVGVNLRGAQAAVAEQFLHAADVGAVVEQVGGEAVPQRVRAGPRVQAGLLEVLLQQPTDAPRAEARAALVQEQ